MLNDHYTVYHTGVLLDFETSSDKGLKGHTEVIVKKKCYKIVMFGFEYTA
jgi:hypothetical protein